MSDSTDSMRDIARQLQDLRDRFPAVSVVTDLVQFNERFAVVRAEIITPEGGRASGFGSAESGAVGTVELAENRAIQRALAAFGLPLDIIETTPAASAASEAVARADAETTKPVASEPLSASEDDEPPLEDYSWTAFWAWARKLGYSDKVALEALIGQSITSLSPAQVRNLLRAKIGAE